MSSLSVAGRVRASSRNSPPSIRKIPSTGHQRTASTAPATTDALKALVTGNRFTYHSGGTSHYFNKDEAYVSAVSYIPCYGVAVVGVSNGCIVMVPLDGKSCILCLTVPYSVPINHLVVLEPEMDPQGGFYIFSARERPDGANKNCCLVVFSHKIARQSDGEGGYEYSDMSSVMIPVKDGAYWVNVHGIVKRRKRREADTTLDTTDNSQLPEGLNTTQHMYNDGMERTLLFFSYISLTGEMKGGLFDLNAFYTRRCGTQQVRFDEFGQDPICSRFTLSVPRRNTGTPLFRAKDISWVHCESIDRYTSPLFERDALFQPMAAALSLVIHTYGKHAYAATVDSLQYTVLDRIARSLPATLAHPDVAVAMLERVGLVLAPTTKKERLRMEERPANERVPTELDKIMRAVVSDVFIRKQVIRFIETSTDRKQLLHVGRWMFNELRDTVVRMDESIAPLFDGVTPDLLSKDAKELVGYCPAFFEFAELVFWKVRGRGQELANDTTRLRYVRKMHALMAFDLRLFLASVKWLMRKLPMCEGWTNELLEEVGELGAERSEKARRERHPLFLDALLTRLHEKTMEDGLWRGLDDPVQWYPPPRFHLVSLLRQNAAPLADRTALVLYYLMDVDEAVRRDGERPQEERRGYLVQDSLVRSFLIWEAGKLVDGQCCDGVRERWESDMKGRTDGASQKENAQSAARAAPVISRLSEEEKTELSNLLRVSTAFRKLQRVDEDRMKVLMNKQDFGIYRWNLFLIKKGRYPEVEDLPVPGPSEECPHVVIAEYAKYKELAMAQKAQLPPPTGTNAFACPYVITKVSSKADVDATMETSRIVKTSNITIRGKTPKKLGVFRRLTTVAAIAAGPSTDGMSTPPSRKAPSSEASDAETARINALMKTPSMRFRNQQEGEDEEEFEGRENDSNVAPDEMARVREALRTPRSRATASALRPAAAGDVTPEDAPRTATMVPTSILKSAHKESRLSQSVTKSKLRFANVFDEKSISPRERDCSASSSSASMSQPNFDDSFDDDRDHVLSKSTHSTPVEAHNVTSRLEKEIEEEEKRKKKRGEEREEESMESGDLQPLSSGEEEEEEVEQEEEMATDDSEERTNESGDAAAAAAAAPASSATLEIYHDSEGATSSADEDAAEDAFYGSSDISAASAAAGDDAALLLHDSAAVAALPPQPKTPPPTPEEEEDEAAAGDDAAGEGGEEEENPNLSRAETPEEEEQEESAATLEEEQPEEAAAAAGEDHSFAVPVVVGAAADAESPEAMNITYTVTNATFTVELEISEGGAGGEEEREETAADDNGAAAEVAAVEEEEEEKEVEERPATPIEEEDLHEERAAGDDADGEPAAVAAGDAEKKADQPAADAAAAAAKDTTEEDEEEDPNLSRGATPMEGEEKEEEAAADAAAPPATVAADDGVAGDEGVKSGEEEENVSRGATPAEEGEKEAAVPEEEEEEAEAEVVPQEEEEEEQEEQVAAPVAPPPAAAAATTRRTPPVPKPRTVFSTRAEPIALGLRSYIYMEDGIEKSYEEQRDTDDEEKEGESGDILARLSPRRRSSSRLQQEQQSAATSAAAAASGGGRKRSASRSRRDSEKESAVPSTSTSSPRGKKERREAEDEKEKKEERDGHLFTTTRTRLVEERYVERDDGVLQHTVKQSTKVIETTDGVVVKNEQEDKETIEEEGDREETTDATGRVTPLMVEAAAEPATGRRSSRVVASASRSRAQSTSRADTAAKKEEEKKKREEKASTPLRSPSKSLPRARRLMRDESETREAEKEEEKQEEPQTPRRSSRVCKPSESVSTVSMTPSKSTRKGARSAAKTPSREPSAVPVSPRRKVLQESPVSTKEKEEEAPAVTSPRKRGRPRKEPVEDAASVVAAAPVPAKRRTTAAAAAAATTSSTRRRSASESAHPKKGVEEEGGEKKKDDDEEEDPIAALRRRRDQSKADAEARRKYDAKRKAGRPKLGAIPEDAGASISEKRKTGKEEAEEQASSSQASLARSPSRRKRSQSETTAKEKEESLMKTPAKKKTKGDEQEDGDQSMLRRSSRKAAATANEGLKTPSKSTRSKQ
ncbi:hypothetical protein PMAYCL1PPCAC_03825 [Pristionchus mayeri]|uniref:Uncharacterized protein n=1 Tax=Pristionchus mayeri TaxID=1317129 RepID=A0AAN4ZAV8_9BILA|nr:hypothetical protein PMAYCL1PPCAC_03825 [Pristionchus mayeri]